MSDSPTRHPPTFSVVVPTYKRPDRLAACLDALAALRYPTDRYEVIVVDDGTRPPESVSEVVATRADRLRVRLLTQEHAGPAAARNAGAAGATGEFLAFTDDDCRPRSGWLEALAAAFENAPRDVLGGHTENAFPENACSTASQVLVSFIVAYFLEKGAPIFPSNNLAVARTVFEEVKGFDTRFPRAAGEDRELSDRFLAQGFSLRLVPEAVIDHYHHLTFRRFLKQHFNYGRGAYFFHRVRARRGGDRVQMEPGRFYRDLVRAAYTYAPDRQPVRVTLLLVLSQLANAAGYYREQLRPGTSRDLTAPRA